MSFFTNDVLACAFHGPMGFYGMEKGAVDTSSSEKQPLNINLEIKDHFQGTSSKVVLSDEEVLLPKTNGIVCKATLLDKDTSIGQASLKLACEGGSEGGELLVQCDGSPGEGADWHLRSSAGLTVASVLVTCR
jgi:hypothetical protein